MPGCRIRSREYGPGQMKVQPSLQHSPFGANYFARVSIVSALLFCSARSSLGDGASQEIVMFLQEMNRQILTEPEPQPIKKGTTGTAFYLAPAGTPVSELVTTKDRLGTSTLALAQTLSVQLDVDKVLLVNNGVAFPSQYSLPQAWQIVLSATVPPLYLKSTQDGTIESAAVSDDVRKVLYKTTDKIDRALGVLRLNEKSDVYQKYSGYRDMFDLLALSEGAGTDWWRIHPALKTFSSLNDAKSNILKEWTYFGYKSEVESAEASLAQEPHFARTAAWSKANDAFTTHTITTSTGDLLYDTYLFPPADSWFSMPIWTNAHVQTTDPATSIDYQFAIVRILRPWFDFDALVQGKLQFNTGSLNVGELCDGSAPTGLKAPTGTLSVFAEQLVLVRSIRVVGPKPSVTEHPLLRFAYPDAINLLGFIVRIMPMLPSK